MLRKVRACVCLVDLLFKFRPRARLQAFLFYFSFVPTRASRPLTFVCISPSRFEFRSQARLRAFSFYFNFAPKRAYGPFPYILISPQSPPPVKNAAWESRMWFPAELFYAWRNFKIFIFPFDPGGSLSDFDRKPNRNKFWSDPPGSMGNINILEFLDAQKSEGLCLSRRPFI